MLIARVAVSERGSYAPEERISIDLRRPKVKTMPKFSNDDVVNITVSVYSLPSLEEQCNYQGHLRRSYEAPMPSSSR